MLFEHIQEAIRGSAELFALFTFFIGLGAGHWLALGRDKRTEFNEISIPIRNWLLEEIKQPNPFRKRPTGIEIDQFAQVLPVWHRKGFLAAYNHQQTERQKVTAKDSCGVIYYSDTRHIVKTLNKCLKYTARK